MPSLVEALEILQSNIADANSTPIPEGFNSADEIAKAWGKSPAQTRHLLLTAVKSGLAERKYVKRGGTWIYYYRFFEKQTPDQKTVKGKSNGQDQRKRKRS